MRYIGGKAKLSQKYYIIKFLVLFYSLVSVFEIIFGVSNAKYIRLSILVVLFLCEIYICIRKGSYVYEKKIIAIYTFFLIWVAISMFRNISITYLEVLFIYLCCYLCFFQKAIDVNGCVKGIGKLVLSVCVLYAATIYLQWINPELINNLIFSRFDSKTRYYVERMILRGSFSGILTEVSTICSYLVLGIGIAYYTTTNKWKKIVGISYFIFALLLTGKRAHLIFSILALLFTYAFNSFGKQQAIRVIKILIIGLSIFGILFYIAYSTEWEVLNRYTETIMNAFRGEDITTGRIQIWEQAFQMIKMKPFIGYGWGTCEQVISRALGSSVLLGAHNVFLQLWAETGVVGMLCFAVLLGRGLYITFYTLREARCNEHESTNLFVLKISIYYQLFFIMYSFTGAPLYDRVYFIPYFILLFFTITIKYVMKTQIIGDRVDGN